MTEDEKQHTSTSAASGFSKEDPCGGPAGEAARCPSLSDLPYEVLVALSMNLEARDVLDGLSCTDHHLNATFSEESYWKERLHYQLPEIYKKFCEQGADGIENRQFWRKKAYRCERIRESFVGNRMVETSWSSPIVDGYYEEEEDEFEEDEEDRNMIDISCVAFCDSGNVVAVGESDQFQVVCWSIKERKHSGRLIEPTVFRHPHLGVICSLHSQAHRLSSGSSDGTVAVMDLHASDADSISLKASDAVLSHAWDSETLVAGCANGVINVFDLRAGKDPVKSHQSGFDQATLFDGLEVELNENQVVAAGWQNDLRKVKVYDIASGMFVAENTVPGITMPPPVGHWGQSNRNKAITELFDGHFWIGGEGGKVIEFDAKSLEVIADHTATLGHTRHIAGLKVTDCGIFTVSHASRLRPDVFFRLVAHNRLAKEELMWERQVSSLTGSGILSAMDFCEERCSLVLARTKQVQLWRPALTSRNVSNK